MKFDGTFEFSLCINMKLQCHENKSRFKENCINVKSPVKFKFSDGHTVGWVSKTEDADLIIQVITC